MNLLLAKLVPNALGAVIIAVVREEVARRERASAERRRRYVGGMAVRGEREKWPSY